MKQLFDVMHSIVKESEAPSLPFEIGDTVIFKSPKDSFEKCKFIVMSVKDDEAVLTLIPQGKYGDERQGALMPSMKKNVNEIQLQKKTSSEYASSFQKAFNDFTHLDGKNIAKWKGSISVVNEFPLSSTMTVKCTQKSENPYIVNDLGGYGWILEMPGNFTSVDALKRKTKEFIDKKDINYIKSHMSYFGDWLKIIK